MRTNLFFLLPLIFTTNAWAGPSFDNLSQDDFRAIVRDFSALTNFTSVSSAGALETFGFELGILAGAAQSTDVQSLVDRAGGSADVGYLPRLSLLGRLTLPYAITVEVSGLPQLKISGVSTSQIGAAVQWTLTDELWLNRFVDIAVKLKYSHSATSFSQIISNSSTGNVPVNSDLKLGDSVYGVSVLVSHGFDLIEPYFALGYVMSRGDLNINAAGSATVFNFTSAQSARVEPKSWEGVVGINFYPFPFFDIGAEYTRVYDTNSFVAKLSLPFD